MLNSALVVIEVVENYEDYVDCLKSAICVSPGVSVGGNVKKSI